MKILGIDIGTAITGWAVIDKKSYSDIKLIDYGIISTSKDDDMPVRLSIIHQELDKLIKLYRPECAAVESLFYFKNQKTVISVAQARGVVLLTCQESNVETYYYTPLQVKIAVTGYGRAQKDQVQKMVKMIFKLKELPKPDDAADAIAIAYCHASGSNLAKLKTK